MNDNINLSTGAICVINALQHGNGTYKYYRETLDRLSAIILHQSDDLGMNDTEAIHTLRVIDSIRMDLKELAGDHGECCTPAPTGEEPDNG